MFQCRWRHPFTWVTTFISEECNVHTLQPNILLLRVASICLLLRACSYESIEKSSHCMPIIAIIQIIRRLAHLSWKWIAFGINIDWKVASTKEMRHMKTAQGLLIQCLWGQRPFVYHDLWMKAQPLLTEEEGWQLPHTENPQGIALLLVKGVN